MGNDVWKINWEINWDIYAYIYIPIDIGNGRYETV
jgi:hypothetical protein